MKITDLKDKLPIKVKLNSKFDLDESFDVNTKLLIKSFNIDGDYGDEGICYKVYVTALNEDLEYNKSIAISDWYNSKTKQYDLNYYESNEPNAEGNYEDTIFVMENDDCFDLCDEPIIKQSSEMIVEEYDYKTHFHFQRMQKDGRWYVTYKNQIIAWDQYRNDLQEWIDINYPNFK